MDKVLINIKDENEWIKKYFNKELVTIDDFIGIIEDLDGEISHLKEQIEDLEEDIRENYRAIPYNEQVGVYDSDFI